MHHSCCLAWDLVVRLISLHTGSNGRSDSTHQPSISKSCFDAVGSMRGSQHAKRVQPFVLIQKAHSLFASFFFSSHVVHVRHFFLAVLPSPEREDTVVGVSISLPYSLSSSGCSSSESDLLSLSSSPSSEYSQD